MNKSMFDCTDCGCEFDVPVDLLESELYPCPDCGLDYVYRNGELVELILEGEDWGE